MRKIIVSICLLLSFLALPVLTHAEEQDFTNITTPTNLTEEEFNQILPNKLEGLGTLFVEMEETWEINGLFIAAIAWRETTSGTTGTGREHKKNLFGTKSPMYYDSYEDSVRNQFALIQKYFDNGRTSISSINPVYCPTTNAWQNGVSATLNQYAEEAQNILKEKTLYGLGSYISYPETTN